MTNANLETMLKKYKKATRTLDICLIAAIGLFAGYAYMDKHNYNKAKNALLAAEFIIYACGYKAHRKMSELDEYGIFRIAYKKKEGK